VCNYDSGQIQHLLVHLFTNSTEARGDATIRVRTFASGSNVSVEIKDNGPGFAEEKLGNMFELPTTRGSGYGLFLCKSIVDQHNGNIEVLKNDSGATVVFSLPVN